VKNDPLNATDPDGRQSKAMGKEIGRLIREYFMGDAEDREKAKAQNEQMRKAELRMVEGIVDISALGPLKDAVEIANKLASGEDAVPKASGALTGEVAGQATERFIDGKIGNDAAKAVGAFVGEIVDKVVESQVEGSRSTDIGTVQTPAPTSILPPQCQQGASCSP